MKRATLADKDIVVKIISETFDNNPSLNMVIGDKGNRKKKIKRLAEYAFIKSLIRNGVYISNNKMGTALFYRSDISAFNLKVIFYELRFAFSLPLSLMIQALKRESYLKEHRFKGTHYYFWFFGVQKGGEKAGFELKDIVLEKAQQDQLPVLLETSVDRNVSVYERYGFNTYYTWNNPVNDAMVRFMKWDPKRA